MTIARLRGEQLREGILRENHFAVDASLPESILNINWANHTEILQDKKVIYKVQLNDLAVGGLSEIDVTNLVTGNPVSSTGIAEGIIIDEPKNKVTLRDGATQDTPLKDANANTVYGRMTYDDVNNKFIVKFFVFDTTLATPAEVSYTMPTGQTIDLIFYRRGNMLNIPEDYLITDGGNFVEGQTDAIADFNIKQLAKDLGITLNNDGNMSLSRSIIDEILVQTRGVTNTTIRANTIIDEVVTARNGKANLNTELDAIRQSVSDEVTNRTAGDQAIRDDLASTATGKGASLIGIEDIAAVFTATNVEQALKELYDKIVADVQAEANARSTADSDLDSRLSAIEAEKTKIHVHDRYVFQAVGGETTVNLPEGKKADTNTLVVTINGLEQAVGINYTEITDVNGFVTGVDFNPDTLVAGDVVIFKWLNVLTA